MLHEATRLCVSSILTNLSVSAYLHFRVWSHDETKAQNQSKLRIIRNAFISPQPANRELYGLSNGELMRLVMALYSICHVIDYFRIIIHEHEMSITCSCSLQPATSSSISTIPARIQRGLSSGFMDVTLMMLS